MPEELKKRIQASIKGRPQFKGRTGEQSAYAIMNSLGAVKGSTTTAKGREMERKLRGRSGSRGRSDRGEILSTG